MQSFQASTASSLGLRGEQLEFRWTDRDFGPGAASPGVDPQLATYLWNRYRPLIRPPEARRTTRSVVYIEEPEVGVIFARQAEAGDDHLPQRQRMVTHALLIGDLDLAGRVALGICGGRLPRPLASLLGQPDASGHLLALAPDQLDGIARAPRGLLPARLNNGHHVHLLTALVARLLHDPSERLAVELAAPPYEAPAMTPDGTVSPQAWLLFGLWETVGRVVQRTNWGRGWQASFSTLEQQGEINSQLLPQLIFEPRAPDWRSETFLPTHLSVSLHNPHGHKGTPPEMYLDVAELLVDAHLRALEVESGGGDPSGPFADIDRLLTRCVERGDGRNERVKVLRDLLRPTDPPRGTYPKSAYAEQRVPSSGGQPGLGTGYGTGAVEVERSAGQPARRESEPEQMSPSAAELTALLTELRQEVDQLRAVAEHLQYLPQDLTELLEESARDQQGPSRELRSEPFSPVELMRPFGTGTETTRWANALYALVAVLLVTLLVLVIKVW